MQRDITDEFYRELDATDEKWVHQKYHRGGYAGWKSKHAKQWLDQKDAQRSEQHAATVALWTKIGAIGTISAVFVAAIAVWMR